MDKQENKQEQSFELSSEKVRSIVGQIPSALIRYGITVIGVVLSCFFCRCVFLALQANLFWHCYSSSNRNRINR